MAFNVGTRLGHYDVTALLGEGGMGQVWQATDTQLNRQVALKILPDAFAADPDRLARFQREAQILARLNHPNIAAIHGIEESEGTRALVLELVEGPTLADRIAKGPIPLDEALPIAKQIAEALEAAHEAGVIHRDLKPANIKVRANGTVKVLDFGLAKALDPTPEGDPSQSPTLTAAATQMGVILGTAAYMAPEQAKGRLLDKRADIWAYGVVLFEMLTGRQAFGGTDISETLAAVLRKDMDWTELPSETPHSIRRLLRRCLERNHKQRLPEIGTARLEIDEASTAPETPTSATTDEAVSTGGGPRRAVMLVTAGVLAGIVLAGIGFVIYVGSEAREPPGPVRFAVAPPRPIPLNQYREGDDLAVSPDGRRLGFVVFEESGRRRIWLRHLASLTAQPVPGTEGARNLLWSPDGMSLVFATTREGLRRVDISGGPPLTIVPAAGQLAGRVFLPGAWSQDGVILFRGAGGRIFRVADDGGEAVSLTELDATRQDLDHYPEFFLSDGQRFVFRARSSDSNQDRVYLASLDTSSWTSLLDVHSNVAYANGYLVYQRDGALMAQPFDEDAGRLSGQAVPLLEGADYDPESGYGAFSLSRSGVLTYLAGGGGTSLLAWFDRDGERLDALDDFSGVFLDLPSLSVDGRRLVVSNRDGGSADVWMVDLERGVPTRFTFDAANDGRPVFSPDGTRVVFASDRGGGTNLYERPSGGVAAATLLYESSERNVPWAFSPDGTHLLFEAGWDILALSMEDEAQPFPVVATGFPAGFAVFSPDGRWFAYCEGDSDADQVYVQPFPPDGTRVRLSTTSGSSPQWSGNEVFYTTMENVVMAVDVTDPRQPGVPTELFSAPGAFVHRAITADSTGARFLLPVPTSERQVVQIHVVLNWHQELLQRVPVN